MKDLLPHIVFDKKINLEELSKKFEKVLLKEPFLIRIQDIFVNASQTMALVSTVAIDSKHQEFMIEISTRDGKTTIRLFPPTDPEKTESVKISMGIIAKQIMTMDIDAKITKTNIEKFFPK